jgi:spore coat polysaccharide biosynthesis protein SpsF
MKIDVIIQARMGSTRLPGKVLKKLNGITLLESLIQQLNYCKLIDRIIIATTTNPEDDEIFNFLEQFSLDVFRGSSLDVLDRYYQCAKKFNCKHIVRLTSDNPLIDPSIVDETLKEYIENDFDYVNNFTNRTYPKGTESEVFSFNALKTTWENAISKFDREHVTPYIYNHPNFFKIQCIFYSKNLSNLHWTVDTVNDLDFVREIYQKISKRPILMKDILDVIET